MRSANPDLVVHGAQFEDGIGLTRSMLKADFVPSMFYQTNAPSFGDQFSEGIGAENTEGVFYGVSHSPDADTPGNAEFVAKYEEMYGDSAVPEDAADAFAAGEVLQAAVEAVGSIEDQKALADWLHENEVETILGPLSWDERGAPTGEFLIGQWQNGKAEIVLPEEAATAEITLNWTPGGAG
jgi:branched-chain amino acid transport system substrate-binding protein